jgi:hypothetical protein
MARSVTAEVADEHGLTRDEWAKVVQLLGRAPTIEELGVVAGHVVGALLVQELARRG